MWSNHFGMQAYHYAVRRYAMGHNMTGNPFVFGEIIDNQNFVNRTVELSQLVGIKERTAAYAD